MFVNEKEKILEFIDTIIDKHGIERTSLLPILGEIQEKFKCVPEFAQQRVAKIMDIHPVEVYSVVSFYSFLNVEKKGKYILRVCRSVSCDLAGKEKVVNILERELGLKIGETSADKKYTLEYTNCMGLCDEAPSLAINDQVYTKLTTEKLYQILSEIKENK